MVSIADKLTILVVPYQSEEYRTALQLRDDVLRKPLGLEFTEAELRHDKKDFHIVAKLDDAVIGCLVLSPEPPDVMKMRQVAVHPDHQNHGVGQAMVEDAEFFATQNGVKRIYCHARDLAVAFYDRLGYHPVGQPFDALGIPHTRMEKDL
jgi:N-acetylglutamate synthase-like GNAT family acetyltransferase